MYIYFHYFRQFLNYFRSLNIFKIFHIFGIELFLLFNLESFIKAKYYLHHLILENYNKPEIASAKYMHNFKYFFFQIFL